MIIFIHEVTFSADRWVDGLNQMTSVQVPNSQIFCHAEMSWSRATLTLLDGRKPKEDQ